MWKWMHCYCMCGLCLWTDPEGHTLSFSWRFLNLFIYFPKLNWAHKDTDANFYYHWVEAHHWQSMGSWLPHKWRVLSAFHLLPFHFKLIWQGFFLFSSEAQTGPLTPPTYSLCLTTARDMWNFNKTKCFVLLLDLLMNASFYISILGQRVQLKLYGK